MRIGSWWARLDTICCCNLIQSACVFHAMSQKDIHLFLCDDICFMDRKKETIERYRYDFSGNGLTTAGFQGRPSELSRKQTEANGAEIVSNHEPPEYMQKVEAVREGMRRGNYYEVVLRQTFSAPFHESASELFQRIQKASPSPYEFIIQMGDEQLVGASPEMFVRVEGNRSGNLPDCGHGAALGRSDS